VWRALPCVESDTWGSASPRPQAVIGGLFQSHARVDLRWRVHPCVRLVSVQRRRESPGGRVIRYGEFCLI
jgi:hypothetical protein